MVSRLSVQAAKAVPVTVNEFYQAFVEVCNHGRRRYNNSTVGLAISGGVDSMALASLCVKLQQREEARDLLFQAFVVDHGARPGSNDEAEAVSKVLLKKGIETKVLKVQWPEDISPAASSNFESLARKYRFQALGKACRDSKIDALFLAHHEDDQAETVLMRLATGHRGSGLAGIKASGQIPECYGIYGVHESGYMIPEPERNELDHTLEDGRSLASSKALGPMQLEGGGVKVFRPLLSFSKERLIATCLDDGIQWFEDATNVDQTMTPRNTIRHIYRYHSLPAALQKGSIIKLAKNKARRHNDLHRKAISLLRSSSTRLFQPRTGALVVRFPQIPLQQLLKSGEGDLPYQREIGHTVLKLAISCVTPIEHVHVANLSIARTSIFPELSSEKDLSMQTPPTTFTVAGVKFERLTQPKPLSGTKRAVSNLLPKQKPSYRDGSVQQEQEWLITRQPHTSDISKHPLLTIPPLGLSKKEGEWALYDGRYWIRTLNHTTSTLRIRPLRKEDLGPFRAGLDEHTRSRLKDLFDRLAPGHVRFTLPAITLVSAAGQEQVLALPTLGISIPGVEKLVEWDIRYKKVEWP